MNQVQWQTYARHSHTAGSKTYSAKKHTDKIQKRVKRPTYKSIPFVVHLLIDDVCVLPATWPAAGIPIGLFYAQGAASLRIVHQMQHIGKEKRIVDRIKQLHSEICDCKHFTVGKIQTAVSINESVISQFRVSCRQSDILEFQISFEDELHECFNYSSI